MSPDPNLSWANLNIADLAIPFAVWKGLPDTIADICLNLFVLNGLPSRCRYSAWQHFLHQ